MKKQKEEKENTALEEAIAKLRKQYGTGAILTQENTPENVEVMSTGSFAIDNLLGCGGLPRGRIMEVYGQESSGKTTLCLFLAAQVQKSGGTVAFLDVENAFDRKYASAIGVNVDKLLVSQPETLEETMDIIRALADTNSVDLIVIDSVAALTPKSELEGEEMLKDSMAVVARLLGKALRILTGPIARSKTTVIFINQLRDKIGVFYGEKTVTPGGKALKFYSSVRLSVAKGDKIKGLKEEVVGTELKITATKNKVAAPWKTGEVRLYFGEGVDLAYDLFNAAIEYKIITKDGNTHFFGEQKIGIGTDATIANLKKDEELYDSIQKEVEKKIPH